MVDDVRITASVVLPKAELNWRFSHSGGPGGQSVNTSDSRVELLFDLTATTSIPEPLKSRALARLESRLVEGVLTITSATHRSQLLNRKAALDRLAEILAAAVAPPARPRKATRPSRRAVQARIDAKRRRGQIKRDRRARDD